MQQHILLIPLESFSSFNSFEKSNGLIPWQLYCVRFNCMSRARMLIIEDV
jgi:hypothetical protein